MTKRMLRAPVRAPDLAVFIGRFQPLHNGHVSVFERAFSAAKGVCTIIGSANGPRSHRNPFTYFERAEMIRHVFPGAPISISRVGDHSYNDTEWVEAVQRTVGEVAATKNISLIGHSKDATSYYLSMFPDWSAINVPNHGSLSSTPMREAFFVKGSNWLNDGAAQVLPLPVREWLDRFTTGPAFADLVTEYNFIRDYRKKYGPGPFSTVDAVVIQSGKVLMIRRGGRPGKGLLALPGGFLDVHRNETLLQAMIRELREETQIKLGSSPPHVTERILRSSVVHKEVYDDPFRDPRARIITHAFLVALGNHPEMPEVKAASDAKEAMWVNLGELREEDCFADHYHIIRHMLGKLPK